MKVQFKKLEEQALMPKRATEGSAAYDLYVPLDTEVVPGRQIIPLGFAMAMPNGYEALIDARSGFSAKGMEGYEVRRENAFADELERILGPLPRPTFLNDKFVAMEPGRFDCDVIQGKIDSDYRGGVGVIVHNRSNKTFVLKAGTRLAQMTFHKVETAEWKEVTELSKTDRKGGFGSTGTK